MKETVLNKGLIKRKKGKAKYIEVKATHKLGLEGSEGGEKIQNRGYRRRRRRGEGRE